MIRALDQLLDYQKNPLMIRCDNGWEFIYYEFVRRATERNIRIEYIQPSKP